MRHSTNRVEANNPVAFRFASPASKTALNRFSDRVELSLQEEGKHDDEVQQTRFREIAPSFKPHLISHQFVSVELRD
jgi:hypothetical protein